VDLENQHRWWVLKSVHLPSISINKRWNTKTEMKQKPECKWQLLGVRGDTQRGGGSYKRRICVRSSPDLTLAGHMMCCFCVCFPEITAIKMILRCNWSSNLDVRPLYADGDSRHHLLFVYVRVTSWWRGRYKRENVYSEIRAIGCTLMMIIYGIWGSHGGGYEEYYLLGYNAV
jgi:hypothetical protein